MISRTVVLTLITVITVGSIATFVLRNNASSLLPPATTPQTPSAEKTEESVTSPLKSQLMVTAAVPDTERVGELTVAPAGANRVWKNYKGDQLPSDIYIYAFDGAVKGSQVRVQVTSSPDGSVSSIEYTRPGPAKTIRDTSRSICEGSACSSTKVDLNKSAIYFNAQNLHDPGSPSGSEAKVSAVLDGFVEFSTTK